MRSFVRDLIFSVGCCTALFSGAVAADDGAIEYRQSVYEAIGGHMQAMVGILRGEVPHSAHLGKHAQALRALSEMAPDVFPPNSAEGDTKALPEIWSSPAEFDRRMRDFQEAAKQVEETALSGDMSAFARSIQNLGRRCKGCHDNFKAE